MPGRKKLLFMEHDQPRLATPALPHWEIGSPKVVVNLRVAVLEERVAEKRPFSSLLAAASRSTVWQSFDKRSESWYSFGVTLIDT